jgi:hypothetical protein
MTWKEACIQYPNQQLLIKVLETHVNEQGRWIVDNFSIVESLATLGQAMERFQELESSYAQGRLLVVSTKRENLDFFPLWSEE